VTDNDDKLTRRAQRREQKQGHDSVDANAPATESESVADETAGAGDAVGASDAPGSKGALNVRQIQDRNARLRAEAAEQRRAKRERDKAVVAAPIGLDASERVDDIFVRSTHAAATWLRNNFRWLQWVVIGGVVIGFGVQGYRYFAKSTAAKSTDALAVGLTAESGSIRSADDAKAANPELEVFDARPVYDSVEAKDSAAEQGYRQAIATHGKTNAGWLARLGLAGVLYDQKKWDEAVELYRAVRGSDLAKSDPDILGRSLEGIGLCLEGKGDREGALQAFRELTNQEGSPSLATLGLYHQARILLAQGTKDKAKELALKAKERLDKDAQAAAGKDADAPPPRPGYLAESVKMLVARIDPALPQSGANTRSIADALRDDPTKLQRMLDGLKQHPSAPEPAPSPAPAGSSQPQ
jgi:tetratricopeptide (TPR) repeat protein